MNSNSSKLFLFPERKSKQQQKRSKYYNIMVISSEIRNTVKRKKSQLYDETIKPANNII